MRYFAGPYFSPNQGAAEHVIGFIEKCEITLDVAVYSLTHDNITQALINAHKRGVIVRILTDNLQASNKYSDDELLESHGIEVRQDNSSGSMHHKFAIDGEIAVGLGSMNWSQNADTKNAENWNVVRLKYVVIDYQKEFNKLWLLNAPNLTTAN